MALTERTRPYEVLIRYNQDAAGVETTAAHQTHITEVLRDGVVISATEHAAQALDVALVKSIVGDKLPGLVAERDALKASLTDMTTEKDAATAERDAVTAARDAVTAELDALKAAIAEAAQASV